MNFDLPKNLTDGLYDINLQSDNEKWEYMLSKIILNSVV